MKKINEADAKWISEDRMEFEGVIYNRSILWLSDEEQNALGELISERVAYKKEVDRANKIVYDRGYPDQINLADGIKCPTGYELTGTGTGYNFFSKVDESLKRPDGDTWYQHDIDENGNPIANVYMMVDGERVIISSATTKSESSK